MDERPAGGSGPPEPPLDRLANLRDVAAADPRLRTRALWRSAAPRAGDAVPDEVRGWPPRTVVDLRSGTELRGDHPLLGEGTTVHSVALLDGVTAPDTGAGQRPGLVEVYRWMLRQGTGLVRALTLVAEAPAPVLVHCAAGKDRTGLVVALALRAVGVEAGAVLADYALTTEAMPAVIARELADAQQARGWRLEDVPREYLEAPVEALAEVLRSWDEHPGGVAGWITDHGGDEHLVERLRARLLTG